MSYLPRSLTLPPLDWDALRPLLAGRRLVSDSRAVQMGDVFVALAGAVHDGRRYIPDALARGAAAVLWEAEGYDWPLAFAWVPHLSIPRLSLQLGLIAAEQAGQPSAAMHCVGITGTNGKTSCAHWLAQAYTRLHPAAPTPAAYLGTLGYGLLDPASGMPTLPASHTTPDAITVHRLLAQWQAQGTQQVLLEASSHALDQGRLHGMAFDTAVFTNLTQDHLDYHGTMAAYGASKHRLFEWQGLRHAVINIDDPWGEALARELQNTRRDEQDSQGQGGQDAYPHVVTYGLTHPDAMLRTQTLVADTQGVRLRITTAGPAARWGRMQLHSPLLGRFNAANLLACLGVLLVDGVAPEAACAALAAVCPARGRMHTQGGGTQPLAVVDYAHTPDALEQTLATLRALTAPPHRLWCVFGCGGARDRSKRAQMGAIAQRLADRVILTNDNPRNEDPARILAEIQSGFTPHGPPPQVEPARAMAIAQALDAAAPGDVVLIAGKGHEDYQEISGTRYPFSDIAVVAATLEQQRRR